MPPGGLALKGPTPPPGDLIPSFANDPTAGLEDEDDPIGTEAGDAFVVESDGRTIPMGGAADTTSGLLELADSELPDYDHPSKNLVDEDPHAPSRVEAVVSDFAPWLAEFLPEVQTSAVSSAEEGVAATTSAAPGSSLGKEAEKSAEHLAQTAKKAKKLERSVMQAVPAMAARMKKSYGRFIFAGNFYVL